MTINDKNKINSIEKLIKKHFTKIKKIGKIKIIKIFQRRKIKREKGRR